MPTFDVVSQVDLQEVRNAVDQAAREIGTRYDFKDTGSSVELEASGKSIMARSDTEPKLLSLISVLEEKLVKRQVSLKAISRGKIEEGAKGAVRMSIALNVGIADDKAKAISKHIRDLGLKGVQVQIQGDQLRVAGKKKDDLQQAIQAMRDHDFSIPLQFINFRD